MLKKRLFSLKINFLALIRIGIVLNEFKCIKACLYRTRPQPRLGSVREGMF